MIDLNLRIFHTCLSSICSAKRVELIKADIHHHFGGTIQYTLDSKVQYIEILPIISDNYVKTVIVSGADVEMSITTDNIDNSIKQFLHRIHLRAA